MKKAVIIAFLVLGLLGLSTQKDTKIIKKGLMKSHHTHMYTDMPN